MFNVVKWQTLHRFTLSELHSDIKTSLGCFRDRHCEWARRCMGSDITPPCSGSALESEIMHTSFPSAQHASHNKVILHHIVTRRNGQRFIVRHIKRPSHLHHSFNYWRGSDDGASIRKRDCILTVCSGPLKDRVSYFLVLLRKAWPNASDEPRHLLEVNEDISSE